MSFEISDTHNEKDSLVNLIVKGHIKGKRGREKQRATYLMVGSIINKQRFTKDRNYVLKWHDTEKLQNIYRISRRIKRLVNLKHCYRKGAGWNIYAISTPPTHLIDNWAPGQLTTSLNIRLTAFYLRLIVFFMKRLAIIPV